MTENGKRTDRERAIWAVVAALPAGTVASYGAIAARAGFPRGARQVATALRAAPEALRLPWHRVVGAGGRLCLPAGSSAHAEQCRRLRREGVEIRARRVVATRELSLDALLWGDGRC